MNETPCKRTLMISKITVGEREETFYSNLGNFAVEELKEFTEIMNKYIEQALRDRADIVNALNEKQILTTS